MRSKITLLCLGLFTTFGYAQDNPFDALQSQSKTHILYDRVFGISNATQPRTTGITAEYYMQVYHEMQRADYWNRLPKLETLRNEAKKGFVHQQIPLSLLITDFEKLSTSAGSQVVTLNSKNQLEAQADAQNLMTRYSLNLIAPLLSRAKTNQIHFILNDAMVYNTTTRVVTSIEYQANGDATWKTIPRNTDFTITFNAKGLQTVNCKLQFSTGESVVESFTIDIDNQNRGVANKTNSTELQPNAVNTIMATIPYQGYDETAAYLGQGEYEIFPDTVDGVLDKPVILLDGFDPGDARNIATIYAGLNYGSSQNLADYLRAQGFDIVLLNFPTYTRENTTTVVDGGVDYIQRNAMILVELLNQLNAQKVGTQKNVVIGPSMGGLIARYALRYMETHSLNHDTRLYISFDAPHLGANVPIGFQHLFNYMAFGPLQNVLLQPLVTGMLKSPAGREMLIDQLEGHFASGSTTEFDTNVVLPTGCPNFRAAFQNELNTYGFPQTVRNVAIANGASNGTMTGTPGMEVMNHTFNTSSTQRAIINIHYTPLANQSIEVSHFKGQQYVVFFWLTGYESLANSKAPTYTNGLDTAPGGRFDMSSLATLGASDPTMQEFFASLTTQYFDFIPTLSSMAITDTTNLYASVSPTSNTPFAAYSIPTVNENHVTLNDNNVAFAINEIVTPTLHTSNPALASIWVKNPIGNGIEISTSYAIDHAQVTLIDMMGKTVYQDKGISISGTTLLPVSLSKGIYMLTIQNDQGSITKKLIKD
jgi:pimeloyl-ACP methyl ester carboxylesterase